jgi:hypothetical protein
MVNAAMRELMQARGTTEITNLVFVINRMTDRSLDLVLDEGESAGSPAVASVTFGSGSARQRAALAERAEQPAGRYPYPEDALQALCRVDAARRTIFLSATSPFTPIETMVAMTKVLHLAVFPEKGQQWLFVRLEAPRWPPASFGEGLAITLAQTVGTRLTKNRVSLGNDILAFVYFALKVRD